MTLTDELLLRYADGQLDAETAVAVAQALATDDVAAERVRLLRLSGESLAREAASQPEAHVRQVLAQHYLGEPRNVAQIAAAPPVLRPGVRSRSIQALAAGLILALGLGAGFATGLYRRDTAAHPVWVMRVVDYHTLYARSTVAGDSLAATDIKALERRFTEALGRPITIPSYDKDAMDFRRGQILEFERDPIIQLAYLPPREGMPMALCLKRGAGIDTQPVYERVHGIGLVRWRRAGLDYVLVGDQSEHALRSYARDAIAQIAAATRT
jgi:anti-sigma factor RsiW